MTPQRSGSVPLRLQTGSRIPIPCRNCGGELMPFILSIGTSRLWCGSCKKATVVVVIADREGMRIRTRAEL